MSAEPEMNRIADTLGISVERRLAGGLWGAYLAHSRTGAAVVVKPMVVHPMHTLGGAQRAARLAMRLRDSGYPIPRFLEVTQIGGQVVTLQEYVEGVVPEVFERGHAEQLIELWRLHTGRAVDEAETSIEPLAAIRDPLSADCRALQCSDDPYLRTVYDEAAAVVQGTDPAVFRDRERRAPRLPPPKLPRPRRAGGCGVDWEGARAGDSAVDLCSLAWSSHPGSPTRTGAADALVSAAVDSDVQPAVAAGIAAGRAIEKLAFGLRSDPDTLKDVILSVEGWLRPRWRQ